MSVEAGDRIVVESERAGQPARTGTIEEVVTSKPPRYRVRWDDGHTSTLAPTGGVARVVKAAEARVVERARP